jgi:N-acetylglutamate synthase-like GNAT family acetyltransferase
MNIELREPKTADDFALYYDLRWRILRKPWTEDRESSKDEHESLAVHLMAWADNRLVGVGRLHFNTPQEAQIRYMAVEDSYSGRGVGTVVLKELEVRAERAGATRMVANARENALSFYKKHGYDLIDRADTLFDSLVHWRVVKLLSTTRGTG